MNAPITAAQYRRSMDEEQLLASVLDLAKQLDILTAHFRPARTADGWRTAVAGDGKGFPDLLLVGLEGVLWRELKGEKGRTSREQERWLCALSEAGENAAIWRPTDWALGTIQQQMEAIR